MNDPNHNILVDSIAGHIALFLRHCIEALGGSNTQQTFIGALTWADLGVMAFFVLITLMLNALSAVIFHKKIKEITPQAQGRGLLNHIFRALAKPLYLSLWVLSLYMIVVVLLLTLQPGDLFYGLCVFSDKILLIAIVFDLVWVFLRFINVLEINLASKTETSLDSLLLPLLLRSLRIMGPIFGIFIAIPLLTLPKEYGEAVSKGGSILLIVAAVMILIQIVTVVEKIILLKHDIKAVDNLNARRVYTQVHVISRTLYFLIVFLGVAGGLMLFDRVRALGTSLLASAGVAGILVGFAAQKTLSNLFAGFQIALTQPIRLDDVVIVENEYGNIEEITLTYVVVHLWDDRRMILPLTYFIEKPFQNWTRTASRITTSVFLYADYTLPVEEVRQTVKTIIETNPHWDKRFWNLQVTDLKEERMQLRILATAADSSKSSNLQCDIREQLIAHLQKNYPGFLPKWRAEIVTPPGQEKPKPSQGNPS